MSVDSTSHHIKKSYRPTIIYPADSKLDKVFKKDIVI